MSTRDFLIELGTEELPPKALKQLSEAFTQGIIAGLDQAQLAHGDYQAFAAPRRLALLVRDLQPAQPDQTLERRGPALTAAFDDQGQPTRAAQGFARSNGVSVDQLETLDTAKGAWLVYRAVRQGVKTTELLPGIVAQSLAGLPIPKRMRWGAQKEEFVRPVHWLVMLFGDEVVNCELLGLTAGRKTMGHRFHADRPLTIGLPGDYQNLLVEEGRVQPDFAARRQTIRQQVTAVASQLGAQAVIGDDLLDEVTALVEWPQALAGRFDEDFLAVPAQSLISSMKEHQKYFHVVDEQGALKPFFITVANIESRDPSQVIAGNERVIRPRLADARFFFETDKKTSLEARREKLRPIVFQDQLGSLFDKTERVARLASWIATQVQGCPELATRAGQLCKSDLVTEMVLEFPELQGVMGQYYAAHDGEEQDVSLALNEQYQPRFAGDSLPQTLTGCALAIADKMDTLVGIFGIGQRPTGSKDPFALRRASIGVLRIIVEKQLELDLTDLVAQAEAGYRDTGVTLPEAGTLQTAAVDYMLERFDAAYQEQGVATEIILSVKALRPTCPLDFDQRIQAIKAFHALAEARALASANKRVSNILAKAGDGVISEAVDAALLAEPEEQALAQALSRSRAAVAPLLAQRQYGQVMTILAELKEPVDSFFDRVLVNADDPRIRQNRYGLLNQLRHLFLHVADISLLQPS